jgi:hypothetical protein
MLIDCDSCAVRGAACGDCVVTVLLGGAPALDGPTADPVELNAAEQAAIAVLAESGLVPPLRLVPGTGGGVTGLTQGGRQVGDEPPAARRHHSA